MREVLLSKTWVLSRPVFFVIPLDAKIVLGFVLIFHGSAMGGTRVSTWFPLLLWEELGLEHGSAFCYGRNSGFNMVPPSAMGGTRVSTWFPLLLWEELGF